MPVRGPSHFLDAMNSPGLGADGGRFLPAAAAAPPPPLAAAPLSGVPAGAFFAGVPLPFVGGEAERAAGDVERAGEGLRRPGLEPTGMSLVA